MDLNEKINKAKKRKHESYDSLTPKINKILVSNGFKKVNSRQEISHAILNGFTKRGLTKNNAIIDAVQTALDIKNKEQWDGI